MNDQAPSGEPAPIVAVVGAGSIGRAFAVVFATASFQVRLADPDADQRAVAPQLIAATLNDLADSDLIDEPVSVIERRITVVDRLGDAVDGASYVQECAPEREDLKRALFAELDALAPPNAVLASASSAICASRFAGDLRGAARCLIAHPGNPPFLIRVIELVPAPFTDPAIVEIAAGILRAAGMEPVHVKREVEGFVFNRLQGAVLREAYCLVRDGIASVTDIDRIVRDGLGLRWSVIGPFETVDLNTVGGIEEHARRLGPAYARMGLERGQNDPWTPEMVAAVTAERRAALPIEHWSQRVRWRDRMLMKVLRGRSDSLNQITSQSVRQ